MNARRSFLAVLAVASAFSAVTVGCGCDPGNNSQRAPVDFTPSTIQATRTPATCGVTHPAFTANDTFTLALTGETDVAPPHTNITLHLTPSVAVGQSVPLDVAQSAPASATTGASSDGAVHFTYATGTNAAELDANPLTSVVVTVTALPTADGQPLSSDQ